MRKTALLLIVLFSISLFELSAGQKGDINAVSLDNPSSVYFYNSTYLKTSLEYFNNINIGSSGRVNHNLDFDLLLSSSIFALRLKLGSVMAGNTAVSSVMNFHNYFDIKLGAGFGWGMFGFGVAWNIGGVREKEVTSSGRTSFEDYFRNLIILHNNAPINTYDSDFSLFFTMASKDIFAVSLYADRFFSLDTQSISFSMSDITKSLGASFMIKTPDYNSDDIQKMFCISIFGSFDNIFSEKVSADLNAKLRFVLSNDFNISLVGCVNIPDINSSYIKEESGSQIKLIFDVYSIAVSASFNVPLSVYDGGDSYFDIGVGVSYAIK